MTRLVKGNALAIPLAANSVDLVITSPPYWPMRDYTEGGSSLADQIGLEPTPELYLEHLWEVTDEMARVCKPTGSIFVNLGDKYAFSGGHNNAGVGGAGRGPSHYSKESAGARPKSLMGLPWRYALGCIEMHKLVLRAEIIWHKPNGLPDTAKDRVRRNHEVWFHFTPEEHYYSNLDDIREPHKRTWTPGRNGGRGGWDRGDHLNANLHKAKPNPKGTMPGSVWTVATEALRIPAELGLTKHYAAFPQEWPRRLILAFSPSGGVVLDPMGGTGTVAGVADALGRRGVQLELSDDYMRLARWRVEAGHFEKSARRTQNERAERARNQQGDLTHAQQDDDQSAAGAADHGGDHHPADR